MIIFGNLIWRESGNNFIQTDSAFKLTPRTPGEVFRNLKKLKKKKSTSLDNIPSVLLKDCADSLCLPLSYLINMSFSTRQFPTEWKKWKVVPIYKNGPKTSISKVIEKIVHSQLYGLDGAKPSTMRSTIRLPEESTEITALTITSLQVQYS